MQGVTVVPGTAGSAKLDGKVEGDVLLDELLRAVGPARTSLVNLENFSDEELERLQKEFERINRLASRKGKREKEGGGDKLAA